MTSDGKHILLSGANLHCTTRSVVNGKTEESVRKIVFVVFSWFGLAKTTRRMDWMDGWNGENGFEKFQHKTEMCHIIEHLEVTRRYGSNEYMSLFCVGYSRASSGRHGCKRPMHYSQSTSISISANDMSIRIPLGNA